MIIICNLLCQLLKSMDCAQKWIPLLRYWNEARVLKSQASFLYPIEGIPLYACGVMGMVEISLVLGWRNEARILKIWTFIFPVQCRNSLPHMEGRGNPASGWKNKAGIVKIQASFLQPGGRIHFYAWRGEELLHWAGETKWGSWRFKHHSCILPQESPSEHEGKLPALFWQADVLLCPLNYCNWEVWALST